MSLREHHIFYKGPASPSIPVQHLKRSRLPGPLDFESDTMSSTNYRLMHNTFATLQSPQVRGLLQRHQMQVRDELYRCFAERQRAVHRLQVEEQQDFAALVQMRRERRRLARDLRWWAKRIEDNEAQLRTRKRNPRRNENRLAVNSMEIGPQVEVEVTDAEGDNEAHERGAEQLPSIVAPVTTTRSSSNSNIDPPATSRINFKPALPPINEGASISF